MSTDGIDALLRKREELLAQVQGIQSAIFHIDQALSLIGYSKTTVARRFANGELIRLTGVALVVRDDLIVIPAGAKRRAGSQGRHALALQPLGSCFRRNDG